MSELQIGLIGLGVIAVFCVVVYNTWLEYRHRKLAQQLLNPSATDVLLDEGSLERELTDSPAPIREPAWIDPEPKAQAVVPPADAEKKTFATPTIGEFRARIEQGERIEPVLHFDTEAAEIVTTPDSPEASAPSPEPEAGAQVESLPVEDAPVLPEPTVSERVDTIASVPPAHVVQPAHPVQQPVPPVELPAPHREIAEPLHLLSPAIDYIAAFEAMDAVPAGQMIRFQRDAMSRVRKQVLWVGFDEIKQEWELIGSDATGEYRSIRAGLQLVDRRGPVAESDLAVFHKSMHDFANEVMAIVDMPSSQPQLEMAAGLDEFCASVDIQIGINVVAVGQVFQGTKIRALAEAAGMLIDASGRFVRADDEGNILYAMFNQESGGFSAETMKSMTTHGLTFVLDVPTVSHGDRVFSQMVDLAKRFADVLKGSLVDDNRRPLPDGALEPIRRQIAQYQSLMAARKLPAGRTLANRLFS